MIVSNFSPIISQIINTSEIERKLWNDTQGTKKRTLVVPNPENSVSTIAAHFDGNEFTPEELEQIKKYAEFLKTQRKKKED